MPDDLRIGRGVFVLLLLSDEPASPSSKISLRQLVAALATLPMALEVRDGDGKVLKGLVEN